MTDNKLIAEFYDPEMMVYGFKKAHHNRLRAKYSLKDHKRYEDNDYTIELPSYQSDWNALMPVVESIQTQHSFYCTLTESDRDNWGRYAGVQIYGKGGGWKFFYWADYNELTKLIAEQENKGFPSPADIREPCTSKIEAVYKAVLHFIKWHNEQ